MNTFKKLLASASIVAMGATANVQASEFVLDSFDYNPELYLEADSGTTVITGTAVSVQTGADAFYTLTYVSGANDDTVSSDLTGGGILDYSEDTRTNGKLSIEYFYDVDDSGVYDAADTVVLDFSGYDAFSFDILSADDGFEIEVILTDSNGLTATSTLVISTEIISLTSESLGFDGFTVDAGFDWTSVGNIVTNISSDGDNDDFSLTQVSLVPEPSALAILGLGLIGLGLRRRKLV